MCIRDSICGNSANYSGSSPANYSGTVHYGSSSANYSSSADHGSAQAGYSGILRQWFRPGLSGTEQLNSTVFFRQCIFRRSGFRIRWDPEYSGWSWQYTGKSIRLRREQCTRKLPDAGTGSFIKIASRVDKISP